MEGIGNKDIQKQALKQVEEALEAWLQGRNVNHFLYDRTYGGIVTLNGALQK